MKNQNKGLKMASVYIFTTIIVLGSGALANAPVSNLLQNGNLLQFRGGLITAGNGAGYNGPDRSGVSIPVVLERGITASNVQKAYGACLGDGDSATGRIGLMKKLMIQVHGKEVPSSIRGQSPMGGKMVFYRTDVDYLTGGIVSFKQNVYGVGNSHFAQMSTAVEDHLPSSGLSVSLKMTHPNPESSYQWIVMGAIDDEGKIASITLPALNYSHMTTQPKYDEWGVVQGADGAVLAGLTLSGPTPSVNRNLVNLTSKTILPIVINEQEIIDCLVDELQKRAE